MKLVLIASGKEPLQVNSENIAEIIDDWLEKQSDVQQAAAGLAAMVKKFVL